MSLHRLVMVIAAVVIAVTVSIGPAPSAAIGSPGSVRAPGAADRAADPFAPVRPSRPDAPTRVVLFGDSLAAESSDALAWLMTGDDIELRQHTFGGTAPCDWFSELDDVLATWKPSLVVASFSGNALTSCMHGHGEGAAYAAKYVADARRYAVVAARHRSRVLFVSPPARRDASGLGHPVQLAYARVAEEMPSAAWAYGGRDVTPGDRYTDTLPCNAGDACGENGLVRVRHPDGLHFCPSGAPVTPGVLCDVDSPGARRFALTVADAIHTELADLADGPVGARGNRRR